MDTKVEIEKFVSDLNWINNTLHDFVTRVAFMEVAEKYISSQEKLKDVPLLMSILNAMANDAVLRITNIYDKNVKKTVSIFYLLNWTERNQTLIKSHVHALNLDFSSSDVDSLRKKIYRFSNMINKFQNIRGKLVGHNERAMVDVIDIRRNLMNKEELITKDLFEKSAKAYIRSVSKFLLEIQDFITMKSYTIEILNDFKVLLKMPDRIFGKSGNAKEWEDFYTLQKQEASRLFDAVLIHWTNVGN
ncbi:MAG: hypothetical protein COV91_02240 [Candidatus Taylorbacteria bacterium CG11_big_fil_rev_8_21_14_0_20_46_11]|uniref:Uncharacterized protein n=1 Tax=Candidatus Taylorbacteria bacterium CG11_big_fil_rev_8_21_14_0_20_46_11 TaxID=1975025 RepID=A0A2H0KC40_9BACT|nr:MAG: hypothetical protein COV91_02240 [Candidatus Taylorbacteria bacterium CG11_big_fil_rev_8_21_14_0_20_46_11]